MGCTVRELLQRVDAGELTEWMAFAALEPFGPQTQNMNFGTLNALLRNVHRKKGARAVTAEEMMFGELYKPPRPKQSTDKMKAELISMLGAFGGKVITRAERRKQREKRLKEKYG